MKDLAPGNVIVVYGTGGNFNTEIGCESIIKQAGDNYMRHTKFARRNFVHRLGPDSQARKRQINRYMILLI